MIEYISTFVLFAVCWFFYSLYLRPKRKLEHYRKVFEAKGYKVFSIPFGFMKAPLFDTYARDGETNDAMKIIKQNYSCNDVAISNVVGNIMIDLVHPDLIKEFYSQENTYNFPKFKGLIDPIVRGIGDGLFLSEGKQWKEKRKILNRVFNFQFIKNLTGKIAEICDYSIQEFEAKNKKVQDPRYVEGWVLDLSAKMFSHVIMESFLGGDIRKTQIDGLPAERFITYMINEIMAQTGEALSILLGNWYLNLGVFPSHRQINRKMAVYNKWGRQFIAQRLKETRNALQYGDKKGKNPENIIEALLESQGKDSQEFKYDQESIFAEFNTFFIAGTDTTSHYLEGMIYLLARHPEIQKKAREEIKKFMKDDDYSYENLKNLRYLDHIQKETTRFYGPEAGLFIREASKNHYLKGVLIEKGTFLNVMPKGNHYNSQYFKDPEVFRPERWEKECDQLPSFVYGGFSAGARTCIGKHLALLESKIGLIKFLKRYDEIIIPDGDFKYDVYLVYGFKQINTKLRIASEQQ